MLLNIIIKLNIYLFVYLFSQYSFEKAKSDINTSTIKLLLQKSNIQYGKRKNTLTISRFLIRETKENFPILHQ